MKKKLEEIVKKVQDEKIEEYKKIQGGSASEAAKESMSDSALEVIGKAQMILKFFKEDEVLEETLEKKFGKDYLSEVKFLASGYINHILEAFIPSAGKRQVVAEARELGKQVVDR